MDKRKTKEIELVETGLRTQFENEMHIRQDMVTRLQKTGDEKLFNINSELAKQTQGREQQGDQVKLFMRDKVTDVIQTMAKDREDTDG